MSRSEGSSLAAPVALVVLIALIVGWSGAALAQSDRPFTIAVVDMEAVVTNSLNGRQLSEELDAFRQSVGSEVERRQNEARAVQQQIADGANSLSPERLAELRRNYDQAVADLRRYGEEQQREGQRRQEAGLRAIEQQLEPVFEQIQAEAGYDLILNRAPGVVIMAGERADITEQVIRRLEMGDR